MFEEKEKVKNEHKGRGPIPWKFLLMIGIAMVYGIWVRLIFGSPFIQPFQWDIVKLAFMVGVPIGIGTITAIFVPPIGNPPLGRIVGVITTLIGLILAIALAPWLIILMISISLIIIAGIIYLFLITLVWMILRLSKSQEKPKRGLG